MYAFMVPITLLAFLLASLSLDDMIIWQKNRNFSAFDILGLIIVGIGVFLHNLFQEKTV